MLCADWNTIREEIKKNHICYRSIVLMYFVNLTTQLFYFSHSETFTYSCVPWQCFSSCNNENGFASTVSWFSRSIFKLLFISFCWDLIDLLKAAQPYLGIFCSQNVSLQCTNEGWGYLSKRWRPIQQWASHLYTVDFSTTKHFINRERMNVPIMLILSRHLSVWLPRVSNSRVCEHSQGKNNRPKGRRNRNFEVFLLDTLNSMQRLDFVRRHLFPLFGTIEELFLNPGM